MISYRDATPADGAVLGGIARATFIETFGPLYKLKDLAGFLEQGSDAAYAAELADPAIEVRFAEVGGSPIGFCKISGLKLPAEAPAPGAMELRQLYIYKPWQGEGIAAVLTEWALARARARGAPEIWLSVFTENPRARRFYARYGFEEVAPYAFMVGDQADEDILCRLRL
jgi:ribosomal protein S18 acetylase RimI-like enzyme